MARSLLAVALTLCLALAVAADVDVEAGAGLAWAGRSLKQASNCPLVQFPHTCNPGNPRLPIGDGQGAGVDCTPYVVSTVSQTARSITFEVQTKSTSNRCAFVRQNDCRVMTMADVKFAINRNCQGAVQSISITDSTRTYFRSPIYGDDVPASFEPGLTLRVIFPTPYDTTTAAGLQFTVSIFPGFARAECATPAGLFTTNTNRDTGGRIHYAYYGARDKQCCGTSVIGDCIFPPPPSPSPPPPRPPPPSPSPPPPPRPPPPSPSPPPPSPPPPPVLYAFPHTCNPGNPRRDGQGAGIDCTPWQVNAVAITARTATFSVTPRVPTRSCALVRGQSCATMTLSDVKFSINLACNGAIQYITIRDQDRTFNRSAVYALQREGQNVDVPTGREARVVFPNPYSAANATGLQFTIGLWQQNRDPQCNNPRTFFQTNSGVPGIHYAYYGGRDKQCCGTWYTNA